MSGYTSAVGPTTLNKIGQEIFYKIASGGETSVGCTINGSGAVRAAITVIEYSGTATTSVVDGTPATNTGTGTSPSTGSTTTSNSNDVLVAGFTIAAQTSFSAWTNSFTEQTDHGVTGVGPVTQGTAERIVSAAGTYSTGATAANSGDWVGQVVAFKDSGGGGGGGGATFSQLNLEGYIFEGDDGSTADTNSQYAGSGFTSGKVLNSVRQGERLTLRAQITNTGTGALSSARNLALFYDHNDGIWSKVTLPQPASVSGSGCTSGLAGWNCEDVDNPTNSVGQYSSIAVSPIGQIWIAYYDDTDSTLKVAHYVGNNGTGCSSGITQWTCEVIDDHATLTAGSHSKIAFDSQGNPWISYYYGASTALKVARYTGTGTESSCTNATNSSDWKCEVVDNANSLGTKNAIVIDSNDTVWVSYRSTTDSSLRVAKFTGTGTETSCTNGSADWNCMVVDDDSNDLAAETTIALTVDGTPWVAYRDATNNSVKLAKYVGSGGSGCSGGTTLWSCEVIKDNADNVGTYLDILLDTSGTMWIGYRNESNYSIEAAHYTGSGTENSCENGSGPTYNTDWVCEVVDDPSGGPTVGLYLEGAVGPDGTPWWVHIDSNTSALKIARMVGSGGSGCSSSTTSGKWQCETIDDPTDSLSHPSITFDADGRPWIAYRDFAASAESLRIAYSNRKGEITTSPTLSAGFGDSILESHADMTSATDTTNRDDADCLVTATWNNGKFSNAPEINGVSLGSGDTTKQCTEIAWSIDTSQAVPGETYRFIIATDDPWLPYKGRWRGLSGVASGAYPTLTISIAEETTYRYSKGVLGAVDTDCDNTSWTCSTLTNTTTVTGDRLDIISDANGKIWISQYDSDVAVRDLGIIEYVGSGGTGCANSAWKCYGAKTSGQVGNYPSMAIDQNNRVWVAFKGSAGLDVAHYVGSGGNCDDTAWDCKTVDDTTGSGTGSAIALDASGRPWIAHIDDSNNDLRLARYVGSGGTGCATGVTDWTCEKIEDIPTAGNRGIGLVFDQDGRPWISYIDANSNDLYVATYVGTGGTGCTNAAWKCTLIDDGLITVPSTDITVDGNGKPQIVYGYSGSSGVYVATYVGSGGTGCATGVTDWTCTQVEAVSIGNIVSISTDSDGDPWIAYENATLDDIVVARYVGSGGSGCTSSAWTCYDVETTATAVDNPKLAFDANGVPWVAYKLGDNTDSEVKVAHLKLPPNKLSASYLLGFTGNQAGSGDFAYRLDAGLSPYTNSYGNCLSTSADNGYCGLYRPDDYKDGITAQAGERPIYGIAASYSTNTQVPKVQLHFQTDLAPNTAGTSGDVVLQIYRFGTTNAWETLSTDSSSSSCLSNCVIEGLASGATSEYFELKDGRYWAYMRVYQVESTTGSINFSLDSVRSPIVKSYLRHGRVFRDERSDPFIW